MQLLEVMVQETSVLLKTKSSKIVGMFLELLFSEGINTVYVKLLQFLIFVLVAKVKWNES
jgi:hypothetical protein